MKIKALLIGMLLASPPVAAWMLRTEGSATQKAEIPTLSHLQPARAEAGLRIPIEVVAKGRPAEWVYIEVQNQAVPEPGVVSLMALSSLLLLRRQRIKPE